MQLSFSEAEYAGKRKRIRREVFLAELDQVVPWKALLGVISPFYPIAGNGRRPYPLATMLRAHLMQNWFGLYDRRWKKRCTKWRRCASLPACR